MFWLENDDGAQVFQHFNSFLNLPFGKCYAFGESEFRNYGTYKYWGLGGYSHVLYRLIALGPEGFEG